MKNDKLNERMPWPNEYFTEPYQRGTGSAMMAILEPMEPVRPRWVHHNTDSDWIGCPTNHTFIYRPQ